MKNNGALVEKLRTFEFPLFTPEDPDVYEALVGIIKSGDPRLLEGFPVVVAHTAQKGLFNFDEAKKRFKRTKDAQQFILFFLMSLAVYRSTGLSFKWADEVRKGLSGTEIAKLGYFEERLQSDRDYKIGAHTLSSVRVKTTFRSYYLQREEQKLNEVLGRKEELSLEYALSQIFSPKQKELFLKKLKGEKFSKTEKEYFSRTVKKKVTALSNQELHRLARQLLS